MHVFLFAVDKRNKTSRKELWVGTNKYPVIQLGLFSREKDEFTQVMGFPLFGKPEKFMIRCITDLNAKEGGYEIIDGGNVILKCLPLQRFRFTGYDDDEY